ncbi:hypothetical protein HOH45_07965 [bacterium]|jgi:tetratricopeptide (TPR) repeat protein|nr:hypothetical protein [bacterium]
MLKKISFFILCFVVLSNSMMSETYRIPTDLQEDVGIFEKQYEVNPTDNTRFDLAMAYAYTGQIIKGWKLLKKVSPEYAEVVVDMQSKLVKQEPEDWKHHFKLAFGQFFKGDKEIAQKSFLKVLELDPKNVWAMGYYALLEGEKGENSSAITWCKKALEIEPNATGIHFLKAEGHRRQGDFMKAIGHMMIVGRLTTEENIELPKEL